MEFLSPKQRFRLNRLRNRWEAWVAGLRQTKQAVMAEQKVCPSCRALVARDLGKCPYCGQRMRVIGTGPAGKLLARAAPTGIPVTGYLILANLILFVLEYAVSGTNMFAGLMSGPSMNSKLRLGASLPLADVLSLHQYWRWITACFLHAGLLHIGCNMWALYDLGPAVEAFYGRQKFLVVYLAAGGFGYVVSGYFNHVSLGASGAIFGLLGVMIAYGTRRSHTTAGQQVRSMAGRWAVYALVLAFLIPGVDNAAHLGGMAAGFLMGMIISDDPPLTDAQIRFWNAAQWAVLAVAALSFYLMAANKIQLG